ncbi:MAG: 4-alpha-glucanotransferase [Marinobacter sp.]|nr:4-alpha-glucanotransferase [Marinobacter sp.]
MMPARKGAPPQLPRRFGVLLHPTALVPECNVLGEAAYHFVDFLAGSCASVWQMLPVGPVYGFGSPYTALSAFAGDPGWIDLSDLARRGWLDADTALQNCDATQHRWLRRHAAGEFLARHGGRDGDTGQDYAQFLQRSRVWLNDYVVFSYLREQHGGHSWHSWPAALRHRDAAALNRLVRRERVALDLLRVEQYFFDLQWRALKTYANARGVALFGDIPMFVSEESADVWAHQPLFKLDHEGMPEVVAGVPPDYFAADGQRWGNPLYDWGEMARQGYRWWLDRMATQAQRFDILRIDHFRGLVAAWEIPRHCLTAREGQWVTGPGERLLHMLTAKLRQVQLVAENLGNITAEVESLRHRFALPGMRVLQFGFDGDPANPHLPQNHSEDDVVYTGTHDNDTALGWYQSLEPHVRQGVDPLLCHYDGSPAQRLVQAAMASPCQLAVVPLQDLLALGSEARFNVPGVEAGNWRWKLDLSQLTEALATTTAVWVHRYQRDGEHHMVASVSP